jgi:predicted nucleic acid-binding protein
MSVREFVDSNVWLYAFMEDSEKRDVALHVIQRTEIVLSTQIVNEVCNNLLRKARYSEVEIQTTITNFKKRYLITTLTTETVFAGSKLRELHCFSYWDSLVIASAIESNCEVLYSEDMQHGFKISGLTIINPFRKS